MLNITKQERVALFCLAAILLLGSLFNYLLKRYPGINDMVNFIDSDKAYPKVDLNSASVEELVQVPYIGEYTAGNIVKYREMHGFFKNISDVKEVKGIREKNYRIFAKYLKASEVRKNNTMEKEGGLR